MAFTVIILISVVIFAASMFTGGKSWREVREMFYGNYYAEDGLINNEDKPNSKEAFQRCVDNGIGIKTEIHLTRDNRVAVSTYSNLSREFGIDKEIYRCTMEELEEKGILNLTQLIQLVDGKVPLILELKVGHNNQTLCRMTADAIKASEHKNIAVCSFQSGMIGWFKNIEKDIFRGVVSAPAGDFKSLSKLDRFMTGNLGNNGNSRPNFVLYRNKPQSVFVKFAIASGLFNGVWTIDNAEEGKRLEAEKDMIVVRGFMPQTVHFKDMPVIEKTPQQIEAEKKAAEKAAKRQAKADAKQQQNAARERRISEILADDDDFEDEDTLDEIKEEVSEAVAEIKEEVSEIVEDVKEELIQIREKLITEEE